MNKIKLKQELIASKPNFLLCSKDGVKNLFEYKILGAMFCCMYHGIDITKSFMLDVRYVLHGKTDGGNNYKMVKNACDTITTRNINLLPDNARAFKFRSIVSIADYDSLDKTGMITVAFNPHIVPELLKIYNKSSLGYTKLLLRYTFPIKSLYSIRIYEYLIRNRFRHKFIISLDELREIIDVPKESNLIWRDFSRDILDVAVNNLEKYTQIRFQYKGVRNKRKFEAVEFTVLNNKPKVNNFSDLDFIEGNSIVQNVPTDEEHVKIVKEFIWEKNQEDVLNNCSKERILYYFSKLGNMVTTSKRIYDQKSFFYSMLMSDNDNYDKIEAIKNIIRENKRREDESKERVLKELEESNKKFEKTLKLAVKCFHLLSEEDRSSFISCKEIPSFLSDEMKIETAAALLIRENADLFENCNNEEDFLERYGCL